jgi:hypothetical protein
MKMNAMLLLHFSTASQTINKDMSKSRLDLMDENHFNAFIFTLQAHRSLPSAALFSAKHRSLLLRTEMPCI